MKGSKIIPKTRLLYRATMIILFASLVFAGIYAIFVSNYLILLMSSLVGIIMLLPYFFKWKYKFYIPIEIELIVVLFIYATLFLGDAWSFYARFWWWDILLHAGSAIVFGFLGFFLLYSLYTQRKIQSRPFLLALFSFSFAVAMGVIWEIFEFYVDILLGWNMQKSGLVDTMLDLIVNTIGAFIASGIGYFSIKVRHIPIFSGNVKK